MSTTNPATLEALVAAAQNALDARTLEQNAYDGLSIRLEALLTEYLNARRAGEAARQKLHGLLNQVAPGHPDLGTARLLSDSDEAQSGLYAAALKELGLDVGGALKPAVADELLEKWHRGGILSPADVG